jgi:hypothetical protein
MNQASQSLTFGSPTSAVLVNQAGDNTVIAGSGSDTMFGAEVASIGGSFYFLATSASSNSVMVESVVSDTIVAGIGTAYIWGGAGSDDIYSDGGNLVFIAGSGSTSFTGASGSNIVFFGASEDNQFAAGVGNETIDAAGATGANNFLGGTGNTLFDVDPAALAAFYFVSGHDGGSDTITGLGALDTINLDGTSLQSSTVLASGTSVLLQDGTKIWLQGYSGPVNITSTGG